MQQCTERCRGRQGDNRPSKLEAEIVAARQRLNSGEAVKDPNPLGAALEAMFGRAKASLTAWQSAIIAAVFDVCLVGVMVIFEVLGHTQPAAAAARDRLHSTKQALTRDCLAAPV
jgi:hypothetical protein